MTRKPDTTTFVPAVSFTGYPHGKTPVRFTAGVETEPMPADFVELMQQKGLVVTSGKPETKEEAE